MPSGARGRNRCTQRRRDPADGRGWGRGLLGLLGAFAATVQAEVALEGVDGALRANVLAHMRLDEEDCDAAQQRIRQLFERTPQDIRLALSALGHHEPTIDSQLEFGEACWSARFSIDPGMPVRVRVLDLQVDGEATEDPAFTALLEGFPLRPKSVLEQGAYEQWKRSVLDVSRQRGYVHAGFLTSRIDIYPSEHAADIALHFDSGPRYRFGTVESDQAVLDDEFLSSYVDFSRGEPYEAQKLAALQIALNDSGYFDLIDVRPLPAIEAEREIPIEISLTPGTRVISSYGVGYSTDVGPRLRLARTNRRLNPEGHQFGVNTQLSAVISELTFGYRLPYGDPRTEWVSLAAGLKWEDTKSVNSESVELGIRRVLRRPRDWRLTQFLTYLTEDFEVGEQVGRSRLLMPGLAWVRLRTDNAVRPNQGSRLDFELRGASDALGSDTSFLQVIGTGKWIWSRDNGARFITRAKLGATLEAEFLELPPSVRFFAGGDTSVRGYDYESLGPADADGKVIGGSHLIVGSVEYEYPLLERWSLAGFVDSGNAFDGSTFDAATGAGFGARWQSPLGPIRVDVGWPMNGADTGPRLHISLGPDL